MSGSGAICPGPHIYMLHGTVADHAKLEHRESSESMCTCRTTCMISFGSDSVASVEYSPKGAYRDSEHLISEA